jgi:hypothetical protein
MAHGKKYGKKGPNRGGRDSHKDLDFVSAEQVEIEEDTLEDKIMRGMVVVERVHKSELIEKLRLYVGPDYSERDIKKEFGRLVGKKRLKYKTGTYYLPL